MIHTDYFCNDVINRQEYYIIPDMLAKNVSRSVSIIAIEQRNAIGSSDFAAVEAHKRGRVTGHIQIRPKTALTQSWRISEIVDCPIDKPNHSEANWDSSDWIALGLSCFLGDLQNWISAKLTLLQKWVLFFLQERLTFYSEGKVLLKLANENNSV